MITIPTPRSANLLQLRGIGGRGTALLQVDGECYGMPVRLVAGDFAGLQAGVPRNTPIVLHIRDPHIVNALLNGTDIVSDGSEVANYPAKRSAGILIQSGLTAETGFVINPGSNLLADIFGVHASQTPCDEMDAAQPAGPEG
ncbi:hypothetical protein [Leisingera sp. ANG-DT]|uniref:hypothetical protein n=1 Tax=Leisingera sp. ANG-DT TaxID=1577897 RepID=UPI001269E90C|nr:hypothetical protein [Leisingera sp. ANG-DT]